MSDGLMLCAKGRAELGWEHRQICSWTETDEGLVEGYRAGGTYGSVERFWFVQATAEAVPPASLPPAQRCQSDNYTASRST